MPAYTYPIALALISLLVLVMERVAPYRKDQKPLRSALGWDLVSLIVNGHFLGVIFHGVATHWLLPPFDGWLESAGLTDVVYRNAAATWPLWLQIPVALVAIDFVQWCVHNLLHRVPWLWETHKAHHSVEDGEMDWIVSFRFQWTEVVVYRAVLYLPLAWFGFSAEAVMFHAIFGTLIGHLNHANLGFTYGPLRYLFNSPRMHIWHHDYAGTRTTTKNFGIIFSTWDWIFGTAYLPEEAPAKLGFPGVETFPKNPFAAAAWPLTQLVPAPTRTVLGTALGAALLAGGWALHDPPGDAAESTPMLGETQASSQPDASQTEGPLDPYAGSAERAEAALAQFGDDARAEGFAQPERMVSVPELAAALGAPSLVLLDVRPADRFEAGHIPSARQLDRSDYSRTQPYAGLSRPPSELEAMLRARGVDADSTVVVYTDGGPEGYRLWWTLVRSCGYDVRMLDGGLQQWRARGHGVAEGTGQAAAAGDVQLTAATPPPRALWAEVEPFLRETDAVLVDTREADEFSGERVRSAAARGGHIPGARHLPWWRVVRDPETDHRLAPPDTLRATLAEVDIGPDDAVVTYCQSGTRSAGVYFALLQLGASPDRVLNYDGSWAEYSHLDLPAEP